MWVQSIADYPVDNGPIRPFPVVRESWGAECASFNRRHIHMSNSEFSSSVATFWGNFLSRTGRGENTPLYDVFHFDDN